MKLKQLLIMGVGIAVVGSLVSVAGISNASPNKKINNQSKLELITSDKAKAIMTGKVPGANIIEFSYDASSVDVPKYDGTLIKDNVEYEVDVNAKTGEIIKFEEKNIAVNREDKESKEVVQKEQAAAEAAAKEQAAAEAAAKEQAAAEAAAREQAAAEAAAREQAAAAAREQAIAAQQQQQQAQTPVQTPSNNGGSTAPQGGASGVISSEQAKSIMLSKVPGGTLIKFEFDNDYTPEYEGEIIAGDWEYDIEIDARTGAIKKFEKEHRWDD